MTVPEIDHVSFLVELAQTFFADEPKNKGFGSTHAQLGQKTFSTLAPPGFHSFTPNLVCDQLGPKASWSTKSGDRGVKPGGKYVI